MTDGPSAPSRFPGPAGLLLALDLGASRIRTAVVDGTGRILARREGRTPGAEGPDAVVAACIEHLAEAASAHPGTVVGIGVSAPGPLDPVSGVLIEPPNIGPGFRDVPLAAPIQAAFGVATMVERDTNVAALAEGMFGAARGARDFLYITVSTGIGGGIVARGQLYGGADGVAGEIGHLPVDFNGPPCGCGARGHLEAMSSGSGIARQARLAIEAGEAPGLAELAARRVPAALEGRDVAEAEEAGDPAAAAIMNRARRAFAEAVVGLVDVFNPEVIVVGGSVARGQGERWFAPAREAVSATAFRVPGQRVRIVPAALGDDVGLIGAVPLFSTRGPATSV